MSLQLQIRNLHFMPLRRLQTLWIVRDRVVFDNKRPIFLTLINLKPNMDKSLYHYKMWNEIIHFFPNFNDGAVEV